MHSTKYTVTTHIWWPRGLFFLRGRCWNSREPCSLLPTISLQFSEWSCSDSTWQPVRNWTRSSGKQGSATLLLCLLIPSMHVIIKTGRKYREYPSLCLFLKKLLFVPQEWQECLKWFCKIVALYSPKFFNGSTPSITIIKTCWESVWDLPA